MKEKPVRKKYTIDSIPINTNGQAVEAQCSDVMFVNYGTSTLNVNHGIEIPPPPVAGQWNWITIGGNNDDMDVTKYVCHFTGNLTTNKAIIIRRNYIY